MKVRNTCRVYLLALGCLATKGPEGGGFVGGKQYCGWAANTASARHPGSIIAGVHGQEQRLSRRTKLGPHNIRGALSDLPAGGNRHDRFPGHQVGQVQEPGLVLGQHLEHTLLPWEWLWGPEWGARAVHVENLQVRPLFRSLAPGVLPLAKGNKEEEGYG